MTKPRPYLLDFGPLLQELMTKVDTTQAALGRDIGVHGSFISRVLSGERMCSYEVMAKLANTFGLVGPEREEFFRVGGFENSVMIDLFKQDEQLGTLANLLHGCRLSDQLKESLRNEIELTIQLYSNRLNAIGIDLEAPTIASDRFST